MNEHNEKGKGESRERLRTFLPVRGALTLSAPPRPGKSEVDTQAGTAKSPKSDETIRIKELNDEEEEEDAFISIGIDFGTT